MLRVLTQNFVGQLKKNCKAEACACKQVYVCVCARVCACVCLPLVIVQNLALGG